MTRSPRNALALWFATALSLVACVAGFNMVIDPFGYFGMNRIGYYFSSERQFKTNLVRQESYDAMIMGDSRIAFTDPKYITKLNYKFVNAGFASASLPELYSLLQGAKLSKLRLLVVGLHYVDLKSCSDQKLNTTSVWDPVRYGMSWSDLRYATKALDKRYKGESPSYHRDGTRAAEKDIFRDAALGGHKSQRYWQKVKSAGNVWRQQLVFSDACLDIIRKIKDLSRIHGFEFVLVFLPYDEDIWGNADWNQWIARPRHQRQFDRLRNIVPNYVDLSYSRFSASHNFWAHDPLHFLPQVGAKIIERSVLMSRRTQSNTIVAGM